MTIEQIILLFKDVAERHKQINGFVVSEDYDLGTTETSSFPLLAIVPTNPNLPRTVNGFSMFSMDFELKLLDLADGSDKIHVYSDAVEILKDIVNEFATHPYYADNSIDIVNDVNMEKLDGFTDEDLYGYGTVITLVSPNKISFCGSPITNLTGFNFTPPVTTVTDNGVEHELPAGSIYTCEVPIPLNATVENSDETYSDLVAGGGTLVLPDVSHTDSDGSPSVLPAQTAMVCSLPADVTITDDLNTDSPITVESGGAYTCEPYVANDWMEIVVDTTIAGTSNNDQFVLTMTSQRSVEIDLQDGSDMIYYTGSAAAPSEFTFTFATAGVNTFRMKGFGRIYFPSGADAPKIIDISDIVTKPLPN